MKRVMIAAAGLLLAGGMATPAALAQSGTGGSGVTVGCGSSSNTTAQNISACGNVTGSATSTSTGTQFALSGPLTLNVLTSTATAESDAGDDLTPGPGSETLDFTFTNLFTSTGGVTTGQFNLTDDTSNDADFFIDGSVMALKVSGRQWILTLVPTFAALDSSGCECTGSGFTLSGITATMTINFDPGNVVGASVDLSSAFGGGTSPAPEPGTLLLLGSGLLGIAAFARTKFAGA